MPLWELSEKPIFAVKVPIDFAPTLSEGFNPSSVPHPV